MIETAWAYLNKFGGGTLVTKGAGQTWTCATTINSQGDNVTWISDWSLTITIVNGLDDNVVFADLHDNLVFKGLHIDGNKAGQTPAVSSTCLRVNRCSHVKIFGCWLENGERYGIAAGGFNTVDHDVEIAHNFCNNNAWNGITIQMSNSANNISNVWVHHNYITHSSDVGISCYAGHVLIESNIVTDMDGMDGTGNGHVCFGVEGDATRRPISVLFSNNIALDSGQGIVFYEGEDHVWQGGYIENMSVYGVQFQNGTVNCKVVGATIKECVTPVAVLRNTSEVGKHTVENCEIYNETMNLTAWAPMINVRANGTKILRNRIWSLTSQNQIYAADFNGTNENPMVDCQFVGNEVYGFDGTSAEGLYIRNNVDGAIVKDNYFHDDLRGIHIDAAADAGNVVLDNRFENVTTCITDAGTGTILLTREWLVTYGTGGISLVGNVPVAGLTNGQVAVVGFEAPPTLNQLVRAQLKVLPSATQGAANWDLDSDYGGVGQAPNVHGEVDAATTYNVVNNQWYDIELVALGFFANLAIGDRGGMQLTVSTAGHTVSVFSLLFEYV